MLPSVQRHLLTPLTGTAIALGFLMSATISPIMAGRCQVECGPVETTVDEACCAGRECPPPAEQPPTDHTDHDAGCCPAACQGCARALFVAAGTDIVYTLPPQSFATAAPADAGDPFDLAFAIFHPPRA